MTDDDQHQSGSEPGATRTAATGPTDSGTWRASPARSDVLSAYLSTSAPGLDTSTVGFDDALGDDEPPLGEGLPHDPGER